MKANSHEGGCEARRNQFDNLHIHEETFTIIGKVMVYSLGDLRMDRASSRQRNGLDT